MQGINASTLMMTLDEKTVGAYVHAETNWVGSRRVDHIHP